MIIHLFLSITILYYYLDYNLQYFTTKVYNFLLYEYSYMTFLVNYYVEI